MSLTKAQLDAYCGGPPTYRPSCRVPGCKRRVGPYYSAPLARDALREHVRWAHLDLLARVSNQEAAA